VIIISIQNWSVLLFMNIEYYRKAGSQDQSPVDQDAERRRGQTNVDNGIAGDQLHYCTVAIPPFLTEPRSRFN
jgi:hypothetical protein